jgi:protein-tyrosine-phosphatase
LTKITKEDFNKFDYILAFDKENIANIERFRSNSKGKAEVRLLGFYHPKKQNYIIEDPWWNDTPAVFENCYNECYVCCESFLKSIYKD